MISRQKNTAMPTIKMAQGSAAPQSLQKNRLMRLNTIFFWRGQGRFMNRPYEKDDAALRLRKISRLCSG
jgi:hypothetical protein